MENLTVKDSLLIIEGLNIPSSVPAFVILFFVYVFIMVSHSSLLVLIFRSRSLHQPMYLLLCNMVFNDAFGATIIIPQLLRNLLLAPSARYIYYMECAIQAFFVHLYGSASHSILMIMAFDRYVAICNPLRYTSIMTNMMVVKLSVVAWGSVFILVLILVGLSVRLSRCRSVVLNPFCDNASLFKLSCENILLNNIYGLAYTVVLLGSSIGSVTLTYMKIAAVCFRGKNKVQNSRALQTCSTHLAVYTILLVSAFIMVILHRFPELSDHRKLAAVMGHVVLPVLNAGVYGLQIKEVRQGFMTVLNRK
ncbi:LOW QUALITY PROTEIN: olfactory receptor 5K1 [Takifugu rubripes]|uniref:LOW QUALITY PROTEIN: olfactory receptor 5K1 n=1 Tax=Takifugu rubripes TaxID=31033 RepID=UPI000298A1E3|nr:LOW QUALITY PROTEIN: olfactory receptor 5K1 [Takifugu rubripes]|eukprot:XP_003978314.1 PREDICTED: olfactory receptor 5K1 [Takifugu rubripes]